MDDMRANIIRKAVTGEPGNSGQFGSFIRDQAVAGLMERSDELAGIWTPDSRTATVNADTLDSGNWHVDLADGGLVVFDARRIDADPEGQFDELSIQRDGDQMSATLSLTSVDFTDVYEQGDGDNEGDAGAWLSDRQEHIEKYLLETYGATDDNTTEWDFSKLRVTVDITDVATSEDGFGEPLDLPDGEIRVQSWDAAAAVHATPGAAQLLEDIASDVFCSKLRAHLDEVAP